MLRGLRSWPLLAGTRGQPPADTAALERLVMEVARFAADHPEVAEFELNPVRVFGEGLSILDAGPRKS